MHTTKDKTMILRKDKTFYDWLFHYNAYTDQWNAFHRDDQHAYWNGGEHKHPILRDRELKTIMAKIQATKGKDDELQDSKN